MDMIFGAVQTQAHVWCPGKNDRTRYASTFFNIANYWKMRIIESRVEQEGKSC